MLKKIKFKSLVNDKKITWLIDLDNTLYLESTEIFKIMDQRIAYYLSYKCRCDIDMAEKVRKSIFADHNNTFTGVVNEKIITKEELGEFLSFVHGFDIECRVNPNKKLLKLIQDIKGEKYIFTNSTKEYATRVLNCLGVNEKFHGIYSVEDFGYTYKPSKAPYLFLLKTLNLLPNNTVIIDDMNENLQTAKKLGINTIHVDEVK